jgi:alanyl-tRNA synthetase
VPLQAFCHELCSSRPFRKGVDVVVKTFEAGDSAALAEASTRGLPEGHSGAVRVVQIGQDIDSNMCCGTHVTNLAQLQVSSIEYFYVMLHISLTCLSNAS